MTLLFQSVVLYLTVHFMPHLASIVLLDVRGCGMFDVLICLICTARDEWRCAYWCTGVSSQRARVRVLIIIIIIIITTTTIINRCSWWQSRVCWWAESVYSVLNNGGRVSWPQSNHWPLLSQPEHSRQCMSPSLIRCLFLSLSLSLSVCL